MRVIFFGTPHFAAIVLEKMLLNKIEVVAVVTKPDKPVGRSSTPQPSPVKLLAQSSHLPLYQPVRASTPEFADTLRRHDPDLFVVVAYSEIFKEILLELPPLDCINVHASLLPKYRGAAPIHRAVIAGEKETGVTIMSMAQELDAGEILGIGKVKIGPNTTTGELFDILAAIGAEELLKVLASFEKGEVFRQKQDPSLVTYAAKVTPADGQIDWKKNGEALHNQIRGVTPKPGAWCWVEMQGQRKKILIKKTTYDPQKKGVAGTILQEKGLVVACGEGALHILELQLEGKKPLPADVFLRGYAKENLKFV